MFYVCLVYFFLCRLEKLRFRGFRVCLGLYVGLEFGFRVFSVDFVFLG